MKRILFTAFIFIIILSGLYALSYTKPTTEPDNFPQTFEQAEIYVDSLFTEV